MIRRYFGEKIAYYFDFLALYNYFLYPLIPLGLVLAIVFWGADSKDTVTRVFVIGYAFTNVLVGTIFIEFLKREEKYRASEWGTTKIKEDDFIRPLFKGIFRRSPIDDDLNDPHARKIFKYWRLSISWIICLAFTAGTLGLHALVFWLRNKLANDWEGESRIHGAVQLCALLH